MGFKCRTHDLTADSSPQEALRYSEETLRLAVANLDSPFWPRRYWLRGFLVQWEIRRRDRVYQAYRRATGR